MTIPFRVKLLTKTAKEPTRENAGDLWDLYADDFCTKYSKHKPENQFFKECLEYEAKGVYKLRKNDRVLVKTGISLELPIKMVLRDEWIFKSDYKDVWINNILRDVIASYAVADIRPRSGLALKHGITVLNPPGTIDNSYRKEIGVILYNAGHEPYTITKGDKIAQMLIRPLYPSKMEIVKDIEDTGRGGYGSTGK